MKKYQINLDFKRIFLLFTVGFFFCTSHLLANTPQDKQFVTIPQTTVWDKIRGGMLGQILGVLNGLPHEMKYFDNPGTVKNYVPSLTQGAWTDDDTDFEWAYVVEMHKNRNPFLSYSEITKLWKERINKKIWCSNKYARHLMDMGFTPPLTGNTILNPWADFNLTGQFLCETYALMAPAMPQTASKIGLNYTLVAINGEPAQVTQFISTMISVSFVENNVKKIVDAGMSVLDPKSRVKSIFSDVIKWHSQYPDNWAETRRMIKEKYTIDNGSERDRNGVDLNTACVVASLLYGKGDFQESVKHAFNFGWDADCNAATVGTILGVTIGYKKMMNRGDRYNPEWEIVDRYKNTSRDKMPMDETITSFSDRLVELFELVNEKNGGSEQLVNNVKMYKIPVEKAQNVMPLEGSGSMVFNKTENPMDEIGKLLMSSEKADRARGCYTAVCLDLYPQISKKYPREWKQATYDLSGYWKVMTNIFFIDGKWDFNSLIALRDKFSKAGFKPTKKQYLLADLRDDAEYWKEPAKLY